MPVSKIMTSWKIDLSLNQIIKDNLAVNLKNDNKETGNLKAKKLCLDYSNRIVIKYKNLNSSFLNPYNSESIYKRIWKRKTNLPTQLIFGLKGSVATCSL